LEAKFRRENGFGGSMTGEGIGRIILIEWREQRFKKGGGREHNGRMRRKERRGWRAICGVLAHVGKEGGTVGLGIHG
jgi:hypothetical protein